MVDQGDRVRRRVKGGMLGGGLWGFRVEVNPVLSGLEEVKRGEFAEFDWERVVGGRRGRGGNVDLTGGCGKGAS